MDILWFNRTLNVFLPWEKCWQYWDSRFNFCYSRGMSVNTVLITWKKKNIYIYNILHLYSISSRSVSCVLYYSYLKEWAVFSESDLNATALVSVSFFWGTIAGKGVGEEDLYLSCCQHQKSRNEARTEPYHYSSWIDFFGLCLFRPFKNHSHIQQSAEILNWLPNSRKHLIEYHLCFRKVVSSRCVFMLVDKLGFILYTCVMILIGLRLSPLLFRFPIWKSSPSPWAASI